MFFVLILGLRLQRYSTDTKRYPRKKFLAILSFVLPAKTTVGLIVQSRDGADNKKCIRMLRCVRKPCPRTAPHLIQTQLSSRHTAPHRYIWGVPGDDGTPKLHQNICVLIIY